MTGSTGRWMAAAAYLILGVAAPAGAGEPEWRRFQDQATGHFQRGNFEQAELFARQALKEAESSLGPEHRATEQSLASLYAALRHQNKLDEALAAVKRLLAIRTKNYAPDDESTAIALHGNAEILLAQRQFAEAEKLQRRAFLAFEKKLGPTHFYTAAALHNLGSIQLQQEQYKEAEK